jgi:hypothetical protein
MILNKKGAITVEELVAWVAALAILGILAYALFTGWNPFKQTITSVSSCSGGGITKGECVASSNECEGLAITGLGCQGEKPVCCAATNT